MRSVAVLLAVLMSPLHAQEAQRSMENPALSDLVPREGVLGSEEGHAINELQYWIGWADYDLAEVAYRTQGRKLNSPSVGFVRSWGLLRWAVAKKGGFDKVLAALDEIRATDKAFQDHVGALAQSVRAAMPCRNCDGKGKIRCVRCHGRGRIPSDDGETSACDACENGSLKCPKCEGPREAPLLKDICDASPCRACEGRGLAFKSVRWPCGECRGVGQKLVPKTDPGKKLP
jgi:hypothetical protein